MGALDRQKFTANIPLGTMVEEQRIYLLVGLQTTALQVPSVKVISGCSLMQASLEVRWLSHFILILTYYCLI